MNFTTTSAILETKIDGADTVWVVVSAALVFITIPGGGLFYSGAVSHSKNKLSLLFSSIASSALVTILWFLFGYSLVYSPHGSCFIGNFEYAFLNNVGNEPTVVAPTIPANAFMLFQCMFASMSSTLVYGSVMERSPLRVYLVFTALWSILVYDFVAAWVWNIQGWLRALSVLDYAGGTPIHVAAGFSALAYCIVVGPRKGFPDCVKSNPTNITDVYIGTALLWFGWFGFNAGSELAINSRSVDAFVVTYLSACFGGFSWIVTEMIMKRTKKMSLYGFCCGTIAGLVAITPAAGFVAPKSSLAFGILGGVFCCLGTKLKTAFKFKYDDTSDVFSVHGIGGLTGSLLTGIFAENSVMSMAYPNPIKGGWLNNNFMQVLYQLLSCVCSAAWSFTISFIILKIINLVPFLKVRCDEKEENTGMDWSDLGEHGYGHDISCNA